MWDDYDDDDEGECVCVALRSRRTRPWLRPWPPVRKSSGGSSRDSRYPESLDAAASMLTGARRLGTEAVCFFSPSITLFFFMTILILKVWCDKPFLVGVSI